jgi:uncharacterized protein YmfQ (DUF2313 family)
MDAPAYARQLKQLLPPGSLWRLDPDSWLSKTLEAIGAELARVDARGEDLLDERDPRTAEETLAEWEKMLGIPDDETPLGATIAERQFAITRKLLARGGQTPAYYVALAAWLNYTVAVVEPRTNLLLRSQEFDNATWIKNLSSVAPNTATAPDGTLTADTLTLSGGGYCTVEQLVSGVGGSVGQAWTGSVWLKGTVGQTLRLFLFAPGGGVDDYYETVVTLTSAWQRYTVTGTIEHGGHTAMEFAIDRDTGRGDSAGTVQAWGAQLEVGAAATPYIVTTSAPVTDPPPNTWRMDVSPPYSAATTYFRSGTARSGDRLFVRASGQLEAVINRWKPAHTLCVFNYL